MKLLTTLLLIHGTLAFNFLDARSQQDRESLVENNLLEREAFEEMEAFFEFDRYLEMSMSMSMSYWTGGPGTGGTGGNDPGSNDSPNNTPSSGTASPPVSPQTGTDTPSTTSSPTSAPVSSTVSPAPTFTSAPSASEEPSSSPSSPAAGLFQCSDQGPVLVAGSPAAVTTPVSLQVLYEVESTDNTTDGFLSDLGLALFSIALNAALECNVRRRRDLHEVSRRLTTSTDHVDSCNVTESVDNSCFTLETSMDFELNKDVDPDYAAFLAYSALQSAMANYTGDGIDSVVRLTYLAPTPVDPSAANSAAPRSSSKPFFSPLAIGACAAMVAGGTLALYVWIHNRRTRNKRHVELTEDQSLSPVSFFSAERDPYDDI